MKKEIPLFMQQKFIYTLFFAFFISVVFGQRHEIGVQVGTSSLVGDIGRTNYIQKPILDNIAEYGIPFYGGILYRMNFNPYQTVRVNFGYSHVQFVDAYAKEQYRRDRKLWGTNSALEADALFEYNFFPVNDEQKSMISPYVFGGVGGILANKVVQKSDEPTYGTEKKISLAIPFGVGFKYKFNYNWAFFGELMFRPTFTDTLDYSVLDDEKEDNGSYRQIGNINSKDWINTVSVGLSYAFGRPPCYCKQ